MLNSNSLNPANITIEAKVRWDGPNGLQQRIIEKSSFAELAQYGLSVMPDGHARVEIRTSSATTSVDVDSVAVLGRGVESHLIATYDGNVIRIYVNGLLDTEMAAPGSVSPKPPTAQNLIESGVGIGNQTQRDRPFNGLIDEVALYPSALSAARVLAHYRSQTAELVTFQYATKVVCGKSDGEVVAPGMYFTAVNVHNPLYSRVRFKVKVAIALPGLRAGPVSAFRDVELGPDEALEIDNPDIHKLAGLDGDFLKGFVVIESSTELDVVAVYTAGAGRDQVAVLHMERVPLAERRPDRHTSASTSSRRSRSVPSTGRPPVSRAEPSSSRPTASRCPSPTSRSVGTRSSTWRPSTPHRLVSDPANHCGSTTSASTSTSAGCPSPCTRFTSTTWIWAARRTWP